MKVSGAGERGLRAALQCELYGGIISVCVSVYLVKCRRWRDQGQEW